MNSYTLHYNDGSNSRYGIALSTALEQIADKYDVDVDDLVTHEDDGESPRILVWTSEDEAENDAGQNAVAELIES